MFRRNLTLMVLFFSLACVGVVFQNCGGSGVEFAESDPFLKSDLIQLVANNEESSATLEDIENVSENIFNSNGLVNHSDKKMIEEVVNIDDGLVDLENVNKESLSQLEAVNDNSVQPAVSENRPEENIDNELLDIYSCLDNDKLKSKVNKKRFMICHVPKGNPDSLKTLCLPAVALKAHLKHMEEIAPLSYMGPCK